MEKSEAVYLLTGVILGMVYSILITLVMDYLRTTRRARAVKRSVRQQQRLLATLEKAARG